MKTDVGHMTLDVARQMDGNDPFHAFRSRFHLPQDESGKPLIYFCGNSLGLQPKEAFDDVLQELEDWKRLGVEGHIHAEHPWLSYHEELSAAMARVVGGKAGEVVIMNTLTVNLHLMMVSFYRPEGQRRKIIIEYDAFPSDKFAVNSQIRSHGLDPEDCLIELRARPGETCLRMEDIEQAIVENGPELALILLGNTNYYTGQFFDMPQITAWGHRVGSMVGFDCAHGAGNLPLNLHDTGCDFAVWCTYKYLNSGPGSVAGCFVHERHTQIGGRPRFAGWWGHNKTTRFQMRDEFDPLPGAEGWQLSNPPILSMTPMRASLRLYEEAGMDRLRSKSIALTGFLESLIDSLRQERIDIITPRDPAQRGCQLSIRVKNADKALFEKITSQGVIADWREPDVIRIAPTPLYNTYEDVFTFVKILEKVLSQ